MEALKVGALRESVMGETERIVSHSDLRNTVRKKGGKMIDKQTIEVIQRGGLDGKKYFVDWLLIHAEENPDKALRFFAEYAQFLPLDDRPAVMQSLHNVKEALELIIEAIE